MTLTSELRNPHGTLSRFLRQHFPRTQPIAAAFRAGCANATTMLPPESLGRHYSTIGTAFDWRLRYYLSPTPSRDVRASPNMDPRWASFLCSLDKAVGRIRPVGHRLDRSAEDLLNRHCVVLALEEQLGRAGELALWNSPLFAPDPKQTVSELLAIATDVWLDDLRALSWAAHETLGDLLTHPAVLNPTFAGSEDIGGADADLILDDCLIEIKTTLDPRWDRNWLYQLLGYVLLDYPDRYRIRSIGIYLARQRVFLRWPLDDVIATCHEGNSLLLEDLRLGLREVLSHEKQWPAEALRIPERMARVGIIGRRTGRTGGAATGTQSHEMGIQLELPMFEPN